MNWISIPNSLIHIQQVNFTK